MQAKPRMASGAITPDPILVDLWVDTTDPRKPLLKFWDGEWKNLNESVKWRLTEKDIEKVKNLPNFVVHNVFQTAYTDSIRLGISSTDLRTGAAANAYSDIAGATTTKAGVMVAADKVKLSNIPNVLTTSHSEILTEAAYIVIQDVATNLSTGTKNFVNIQFPAATPIKAGVLEAVKCKALETSGSILNAIDFIKNDDGSISLSYDHTSVIDGNKTTSATITNIPMASTTSDGLLSMNDKKKIDTIDELTTKLNDLIAQVNPTTPAA